MSVTATRLERVHVRCEGLDAITARLRLDQLLAAADLRPPGLPPAALLCVRRLSDPLPGTLAIGGGQVRPPPAWERAFVAALEQLMRAAARPAFEAVPAGAEAVLFADRAELLACLARDVCDGTAWTRWWWRGLSAREGITPGTVVEMWLAEPAYGPAALELLATRSAAVRFARTLSAAVATELAACAATAFAAPALRAAIVTEVSRWSRDADQPVTDDAPDPPWRETVPEAAETSLTAAQQLVLGVLLTLRRTPAVSRSRAFATGVESWRAHRSGHAVPDRSRARQHPERHRESPAIEAMAAAQATARDRSPPVSGRAAAPGATMREPPPRPPAADPAVDRAAQLRNQAAQAGMPADESVAAPGGLATPADREARARSAAPPAPARVDPPARAVEAPPGPQEPLAAPAPSAAPHPGDRARREVQLRSGPSPLSEPAVPSSTDPLTAAEPEPLALAVDTDLGGIFYLLNLALHLELYGDFTTPLQPGIGLDPWDFIELVGGWLLGRRSADTGRGSRSGSRDADPIWGLLAGLAGRDRQPAGRGFRAPRRWRVPPAWLEPVACEGVWRWSAARGTLRILHPAGFPVTAVPRTTAAPAEQLRAELRRLPGRRPPLARAALSREPKDPLACWVARFGAYARVRLAHSLGLADPAHVTDVLLAHRARVLVSPTHVDVRFALAELPLEIRLAGLDRTPGWIPAAGRFVAFAFA
jgi:hypothetical protein